MPSESDGGGRNTGTSGATASARGGDGGGGGNGGNNGMGANAAPSDGGAPPSGPPSGDNGDNSAIGVRDTDSGLSAVAPAFSSGEDRGAFLPASPFAAFTSGFQTTPANAQALRDQETVRSFLAQVAKDKETALSKPGEQYNVNAPNVGTSVTNALDAARASGLNVTNFTVQGGKNGVERNVESQSTNIPIARFLGYTGDPGNSAISYSEAKMLKALGAGDLSGVNLNSLTGTGLSVADASGNPWSGVTMGNIGQDANSVVATADAAEFVGKLFDVAKNFIPGYGAAMFIANLVSGKMTVGQAVTSLLGDRVASMIGVSPAVFRGMASGAYGNTAASYATGLLNSYAAKETNMDPRLTGTILSQTTDLSSIARKAASPLNVGPNISGAVAGAVDSGLSKLGFTGFGDKAQDTSGNIPYTGTDTQSQVDNILNPSGMGSSSSSAPSSAPAATPAATGNISSAGPSSGSYAGALSSMANLGPTSGLYRVGNTNYTPYSQNLDQLNLAADEFTKQSDIGNIPVYNTDVAKMASAPFAQASDPYAQYNDPFAQYAAAGGSIRHFNPGGDVNAESVSASDSAPAPTAEQLAQRAELQARAQHYRNLDAEKQNADIMSALKNLSGVGAAEAKPQSSPLLRLGQVGNYTPPKVLPQLAALLQARGMRLAEGGQPDDHKHPNYDGNPVFRTGGLSGLGGKYVEGKGDGTSDDITAMLADGEYVFSADVVSALGNGSNKAGAQVLDKTVQAIRSRARSTAPDKLPPDAKSPLEYMQAVKGKKYG